MIILNTYYNNLFLLKLFILLCMGIVTNAVEMKENNNNTDKDKNNEIKHEYCIIGAGPGGIQLGYFLQKNSRDYVILEQNDHVASFYDKLPHNRRLISINKKYMSNNDPEFRLRHDWNSLISDDNEFRMTNYTNDYYPTADVLLEYLGDYAKKYKLNIMYNHKVSAIARAKHKADGKDKVIFILRVHVKAKRIFYVCKRLIVANGMQKVNKPQMNGTEYVTWYPDMKFDADQYRGKSILILGKGNSAFEIADFLTPLANHIHIVGRHVIRLSFFTHYVGDVRAVNSKFLDQYQLKSLDGMLEGSFENMALVKNKDGTFSRISLTDEEEANMENDPMRESYNAVIGCTGFVHDHSMFNQKSCVPSYDDRLRYPLITSEYESIDIPNLFFAGAIMHSNDYKKSSGGFIHGFRYLVKVLFNVMEERYHQVRWPSIKFEQSQGFFDFVLKHLNRVSSLYQMFGFLCDVVILTPRDNGKSNLSGSVSQNDMSRFDLEYFFDVPKARVHKIYEKYSHNANKAHFLTVTLQYGDNFRGPQVFSTERAVGDVADASVSNFLHPVWREYDQSRAKWPQHVSEHHTLEDFLTDWTLPTIHRKPLAQYLDAILFKEKKLTLPKKQHIRQHYNRNKHNENDMYKFDPKRKEEVKEKLGEAELEGWDQDPYRPYIRKELINHLVEQQNRQEREADGNRDEKNFDDLYDNYAENNNNNNNNNNNDDDDDDEYDDNFVIDDDEDDRENVMIEK